MRIETRLAAASLQSEEVHSSLLARRLASLIFDPLPALVSASSQNEGRRWELTVRSGVAFHTGMPLTARSLAAALEEALGKSAVTMTRDGVVVEFSTPIHALPEILIRAGRDRMAGTGPFRLAEWRPRRRAVFVANEEYWGGRPFLDRIEIEMGRSPREQLIDLEVDKADLVDVDPGEFRRASERGRKIWSSEPVELMALVFNSRPSAVDLRVREALALAIDRAAMHNVLLQRKGEMAGTLLPQWISGYAFLFSTSLDLARARSLVAQAPAPARTLTLSYDPASPLARALAERVALNAGDAGIAVQIVAGGGRPALRLVQLRISSANAQEALAAVAGELGLAAPPPDSSPQALFDSERRLLQGFEVIPLFHLPELFAVGSRVRTWLEPGLDSFGNWRLANLWVWSETP